MVLSRQAARNCSQRRDRSRGVELRCARRGSDRAGKPVIVTLRPIQSYRNSKYCRARDGWELSGTLRRRRSGDGVIAEWRESP